MPGYSTSTPHPFNGGVVQGNFPQQQALSSMYANATNVLLGVDQQQNGYANGPSTHQQDPWLIIQKMSEDNRMLIEQISRLTTQLTHLQSMLYQQQHQQQMDTAHLSAAPAVQNEQMTLVTTITGTGGSGPKRTLSPFNEEITESIEMDNDPNTRTVISTQKKRRAAELTSISASPAANTNLIQRGVNDKHTTSMEINRPSSPRIFGNGDAVGAECAQQWAGVSDEAKRFAQSRFPFSPFIVTMQQNIRDKIIVEFLCKYVKDNHQLELELAGYRRTMAVGSAGEFKTLLFVKNINTFTILLDQQVWPKEICGHKFELSCPSIPPQLAVVLPDVPMNINMDDLSDEIRSNYNHVVAVVRLRNRSQREIKAVKIEFNSIAERKDMLEKKRLLAMGLSLQVVEYLAQAHVLICSQCMCIGHFRKNCPQKNEITCGTCGNKCADIKEHKIVCSGVVKCIHCGGAHKSNDTKCPIVKDYRAALTKSLLSDQIQQDGHSRNKSRYDLTNASSSSSGWLIQSRMKSEIWENRWQSVVDELHSSKLNIHIILNELCDIVINLGESGIMPQNGEQAKNYQEKTKSIKNFLNTLITQVSTAHSS
jgi:hypothetical protein